MNDVKELLVKTHPDLWDKDGNAIAAAPASGWDILRAAWKAGHNLPTNSADRKLFPVRSGVIEYTPAALVALALGSKIGNDKHNPGQPLQHSRAKSSDHGDCEARHMIDVGDPALDTLEELTWKAWRANMELQLYAESLGAPRAPRAR
jgi:hypothetical protein